MERHAHASITELRLPLSGSPNSKCYKLMCLSGALLKHTDQTGALQRVAGCGVLCMLFLWLPSEAL